MTIDEFIAQIDDKQPPAPSERVTAFERTIGGPLPDDYRAFVIACNGGYLGGALPFRIPPDNNSSVNHIGGLRDEDYFSLELACETYDGRIPRDLIWIMDDPGGNALCLGIGREHRGRVYFWSHEFEPDDEWDGMVESAGNVTLIASSFTEFVGGLQRREPKGLTQPHVEPQKPWWKLW